MVRWTCVFGPRKCFGVCGDELRQMLILQSVGRYHCSHDADLQKKVEKFRNKTKTNDDKTDETAFILKRLMILMFLHDSLFLHTSHGKKTAVAYAENQ